ncbi:MAG: type III secretion system chaperone [Desulfovibrio sp.]|nr:type III secretion system chaperone [Desulfovibrio sp.]
MYAEICDVADLTPDKLGGAAGGVPAGLADRGAAFAVVRNLGKIVLWKRHDDDFPDVAALERAINSFLTAVITWKGRLASGTTDAAAAGAAFLPAADDGGLRA